MVSSKYDPMVQAYKDGFAAGEIHGIGLQTENAYRQGAEEMREQNAKTCEVDLDDESDQNPSPEEVAWNSGYEAACRSNAQAIRGTPIERKEHKSCEEK